MTKEKQAEIVLTEEDLSELYTEEKLLKSHILNTTKVSADKAEAVKSAKLKSSCLAVVLSAFLGLFGAGSFYLGYWKRGICKVVFNVLLPVALGVVFLYWLAPMQEAVMQQFIQMLCIIFLAIDGTIILAYWIGEVFKDRAKCFKDNYRKINNLINQ